jgi:hypothetical protein
MTDSFSPASGFTDAKAAFKRVQTPFTRLNAAFVPASTGGNHRDC